MMNNFNGNFGKKKSNIIRVDESFRQLVEEAKCNISKTIRLDPSKIPTTMATRKVVDWARLGRQFELKAQNKRKDEFADQVARFMDRIT